MVRRMSETANLRTAARAKSTILAGEMNCQGLVERQWLNRPEQVIQRSRVRRSEAQERKARMIDRSQRVAARVYAATSLLTLAIIMVAFTQFLAPNLVWNNGEATAHNMIAHQAAFHKYLIAAYLNGVGGIVLLVAQYVILRPINRGMALFAALSNLVYAGTWFGFILLQLLALRTMGSVAPLKAIEPAQAQALAGLLLDSGWDAYYIGLPFLGLGSALFAWLFFRSRYVPRALALYGVVAAAFEGVCAFLYLFFPGFGTVVSVNWYEMPEVLFGLVVCLWLLIRGLSPRELKTGLEARA
jgi:hypothetical protein